MHVAAVVVLATVLAAAAPWQPHDSDLLFMSARSGNSEVYVRASGDTTWTNLTRHPSRDNWPVWSPDGKTLAYCADRNGNFDIYIASGDGSQPSNATSHPAIDNFPTWSPDGRLTFVSNRDGGFDIFVEAVGSRS